MNQVAIAASGPSRPGRAACVGDWNGWRREAVQATTASRLPIKLRNRSSSGVNSGPRIAPNA